MEKKENEEKKEEEGGEGIHVMSKAGRSSEPKEG